MHAQKLSCSCWSGSGLVGCACTRGGSSPVLCSIAPKQMCCAQEHPPNNAWQGWPKVMPAQVPCSTLESDPSVFSVAAEVHPGIHCETGGGRRRHSHGQPLHQVTKKNQSQVDTQWQGAGPQQQAHGFMAVQLWPLPCSNIDRHAIEGAAASRGGTSSAS